MLPCFGYCKQYPSEHWGVCVLSGHVFLQINVQEWDCRIVLRTSGQTLCVRAGGRNRRTRTLTGWQEPVEMVPVHRQLPKTFTFLSSCPQGPQCSPQFCYRTWPPCVFPVGWAKERRGGGSLWIPLSWASSARGPFGEPCLTGHDPSLRAIHQGPWWSGG